MNTSLTKLQWTVAGAALTAVVVTYAPAGKPGTHHHAGSVFAYVLLGAMRSENSATGRSKSTIKT